LFLTSLAPECPYPAAVKDSYAALLWLLTAGIRRLHINPAYTAIGGSSAGGNLAAVMTHKLLSYNASFSRHQLPMFKAQLLIVPVTDNTASIYNNDSWCENEFVPALPAEKMMWYRRHYLPKEQTWGDPEASPLLYGDDDHRWEKLPRALIVVGELDILRSEGELYARRLQGNGVPVQLRIMEGMPHPFLAMDEILQQGRDAITFMVETLREAFGKNEC
jgi:acetyl esterase/lipase